MDIPTQVLHQATLSRKKKLSFAAKATVAVGLFVAEMIRDAFDILWKTGFVVLALHWYGVL